MTRPTHARQFDRQRADQQELAQPDLKRQAQQASQEAKTWVVWLARFGYVAKGLVYIIVSALAAQAALGSGGRTTGPSGALSWLSNQAFGTVLLSLIAFGLFGYALWRFIQTWVDPEHVGLGAKGVGKRIGYVVSGLIYGGLGVQALRIAFGSASGNNGDQTDDWTARLMAQPFGVWLVGIVGAIVIGVGVYQFYRAYTAHFRKKLKLHEMSPTEQIWATRAGRIGYAARGVVSLITGAFFIVAAWQTDPQEAAGMGQALQKLGQQPYGPWLLAIVALGLVAYGIYGLIEARYRRIYIDS